MRARAGLIQIKAVIGKAGIGPRAPGFRCSTKFGAYLRNFLTLGN